MQDKKRKYEVWSRAVIPLAYGKFSWIIAIVSLDDWGEPNTITFPLKYTSLRDCLDNYCFTNLFEPGKDVEFTDNEELITRVPPLGK